MVWYFASIWGFLGFVLFNTLLNLFILRQQPIIYTNDYPHVSILVPARNEDRNILRCVNSLLEQDYPFFDVIVLDDQSTDNTAFQLQQITDPRLRVIKGQPLENGWTGKNWACHQLRQATKSDFILFTDADTFHYKNALRNAMNVLLSKKLACASYIVRFECKSFGEYIIQPITFFFLVATYPYYLTKLLHHGSPFNRLNGQYMLFRSSAYDKIGGYASIRELAVDDVALCHRLNSHKLEFELIDGRDSISTRMYHGFWESWNGIARLIKKGFQSSSHHQWIGKILHGFIIIFFGLILLLWINVSENWVIILTLFITIALSYQFVGIRWYWAILYPIAIFLLFVNSLISFFSSTIIWKNRKMR